MCVLCFDLVMEFVFFIRPTPFRSELLYSKSGDIIFSQRDTLKLKCLQTYVEFLCSPKVTETTKNMDEVNTNLLKENRAFQSELLQEKEVQSETLRSLRNYKLRYWHPCLQS